MEAPDPNLNQLGFLAFGWLEVILFEKAGARALSNGPLTYS